MVKKSNPRNIKLLGGSSLFNDMGSEMVTALLPFYITALGGAGVAVGVLSGLREGLSSIFKLLGGWVSDRKGKRKGFVFGGYSISAISRLMLAFVATWQAIVALVSVERLGKLRDPPRDAIIADSTKRRGKGFGIHQAFDSLGAMLGIVLVILLFWRLELGFRTIIIIAAAISALSLIPLFFVKEPKIKPIKKSLFKGIKKLDRKLKYFIFVVSVFTIANFGLYFFMILLARDLTGSVLTSLILYGVFNLVFMALVIPFGRWSDKIGQKKVLFLGYSLFLILTLSFIYFTSLAYLAIAFALYGVVLAMTMSNQKALAANLSGRMKGTAMGTFHSVIGLVNIPAGIIAGILWDISYQTMFIYLSIVTFISIVLLSFVKEQ